MGNNTIGSTKISYSTKDKLSVQYIYYDLKGKNRFPPTPSSEADISAMFEKCLREIEATPEQLELIRDFSPKYQFRFVVLHGRKVNEHRERSELDLLRRTHHAEEDQFRSVEDRRRKDLEEKMAELEASAGAIKMPLSSIDRYISEKNAWTEFIKIDGIRRLVVILDRAIAANKQGTKTIFQSQIEILKFLKSLSDHNSKEYFAAVAEVPDYARILLRAYHPVNVAVTAYVLMMLQDYAWKVEESVSVVEAMEAWKEETGAKSMLEAFAQCIYETDNILMCCYNLRFLNEILISIVDDEEKARFEENLREIRYELLIEDIKSKLQENFYRIENCSFISVNQKIYKHATQTQPAKDMLAPAMMNRSTLNLDSLQQHLLVHLLEGNELEQDSEEDDDENYLTVYLVETDKKGFNKFIFDTFSEIQHYYKYSLILDECGEGDLLVVGEEEVGKLKKYGLTIEEYTKRIKGSCTKNNCEEIMLTCLKTMQYFDKNEWKQLEILLAQDLKNAKTAGADQENLRKQLQEKEKESKQLKKELMELKTEMVGLSRVELPKSNLNVSKLDMTLFEIPSNQQLQFQNTQPSQNNPTPFSGLLPPPPTLGLPTLPPPPQNNGLPSPNMLPPPPTMGLPNLPPPPTMGLPNLPPPPSMPSLPPPPSMSTTLPPPPGLPGLPPPPTMPGLPNLPPPPTMPGLPNLPPPPTMPGLPNLPPPPTMPGLPNLPPPPTMHGLPNLPPPPSFNGLPGLPPPPPGLPNLPPPPSFSGLPGLPPPPGLPGLPAPPGLPGLPQAPSLPGMPSLPGIPTMGMPMMVEQKVKEKRKPKVPMKACNYVVLGYQKIANTVWEKLDDTKLQLDEDELEMYFGKPLSKEQPKTQSAINLTNEVKKKEPIKLLGSDRWRNMEIVLTKLKLPDGVIAQALTECSGKYANFNVLESVVKLLPTQEEEMNIRSFEGDTQDLGRPERFMKELTTVPQFANRLKAMMFANIKDEMFFEIQKKIEDLTCAFESLQVNYRLHYVLEVALAVGNYLNGPSVKGGAWGFKLETLQRMQEVKSQDNRMNAGFYLIKEVWKKYTYPIFDKDEVEMYQFISKLPLGQIKAELAELKRYTISIEKAFKSKNHKNPNDHIDEHCEELMHEAKEKYTALEESCKKLEAVYQDCATFYCEDPTKGASDEIGKKIFKSILYVFNTEKMFYEIEEKRKKEEGRKATTNSMAFNSKIEEPKHNPEIMKPPAPTPIKLPMPPLPPKPQVPEISAEERMKEIEKSQQEKEKKFLEEMMKKRTSKIVAFRQSRAPNMPGTGLKKNQEIEIDFLKGL